MGCTPSKPALESAEEPDIPAPEAGSSDDGELVAFAEESGASNKFHESVGLLARLFQVPMVTVTTTLGGRRLCLCAAQGMTAEELVGAGLRHWRRLVDHPGLLVIEDAEEEDPQSRAAVAAAALGIQFYAGVGLVGSSGQSYGTLSVLDHVPRVFPPDAAKILSNVGTILVRELEKAAAAGEAPVVQKQVATATEPPPPPPRDLATLQPLFQSCAAADEPLMVCSLARRVTQVEQWRVLFVNQRWCRATGLTAELAAARGNIWQLFRPEDPNVKVHPVLLHDDDIERRLPFDVAVWGRLQCRPLMIQFRPVEAEAFAKALGPECALYQATISKPELRLSEEQRRSVELYSEGVRRSLELRRRRCPAPSRLKGGGELGRVDSEDGSSPRIAAHTPYERASAAGAPHGAHGSCCEDGGEDVELVPRAASIAELSKQSVAALMKSTTFYSSTSSGDGGQLASRLAASLRLGPLIAKGSYGRMHRSTWLGVNVAVKIIEYCAEEAGTPGKTKGALLEAVLSRSLAHPKIIQTFDYEVLPKGEGDAEGRQLQEVWIVQELCQNGSLAAAIKNNMFKVGWESGAAPDMGAILETALEIAGALSYLHAQDCIHADLTPRNVLLAASTKDARGFMAKVGDFGLARLAIEGDGSSIATATRGTVSHQPPELLAEGRLTAAADVYAFGVLLWEMYTGRVAWQGVREPQVIHALAVSKKGLELPEDAPAGFQALFRRCTEYEAEARPSMDEVLHELEALAHCL